MKAEDDYSREDENRYIRFSLASNQYAAKLVDIQEVLEYIAPKKVPNSCEVFEGVINVRGEIVGVIDLRKLLNYPSEITQREVLLMFKTNIGPMACIVDSLLDIKEITNIDTEAMHRMKSRVHHSYLRGLSLNDSSFDTIVDLKQLLEDFNVVSFEELKKGA